MQIEGYKSCLKWFQVLHVLLGGRYQDVIACSAVMSAAIPTQLQLGALIPMWNSVP